MKVGDLVKLKFGIEEVPSGTVGLISNTREDLKWTDETGYMVEFGFKNQYGMSRYLFREKELEVISESR
jgi:hypothetical protein